MLSRDRMGDSRPGDRDTGVLSLLPAHVSLTRVSETLLTEGARKLLRPCWGWGWFLFSRTFVLSCSRRLVPPEQVAALLPVLLLWSQKPQRGCSQGPR